MKKVFNRQFVNKGEWKEKYIFTKYILPFLFIMGLLGVILGNRDSFMLFIVSLMAALLFITYTKSKDNSKTNTQNSEKIEKSKTSKIFRIAIESLLILISIFIIYDTVRYTISMAQVQFQNEGYVTGNVRSGGYEGSIYVEEKEDNMEYRHIFDGWKYLSKVEVKEDDE